MTRRCMQSVSTRPFALRAICAHPRRAWQSRRHSRVVCPASPLVYIATLPLVGWESLEAVLKEQYPNELALHCMVVVETEGSVAVFDFLPEVPKSLVVAAALLCGRQVRGVVRERRLSQLPVRRCWLVGPCTQRQVKLTLLSSM